MIGMLLNLKPALVCGIMPRGSRPDLTNAWTGSMSDWKLVNLTNQFVSCLKLLSLDILSCQQILFCSAFEPEICWVIAVNED